jgi:hypothetical protein
VCSKEQFSGLRNFINSEAGILGNEPEVPFIEWKVKLKEAQKMKILSGSPVKLGSVAQVADLKTKEAQITLAIRALNRDYGAGVTGREILNLVKELSSPEMKTPEQKREYAHACQSYLNAMDSYLKKSSFGKWRSGEPQPPDPLYGSIHPYDIYRHYQTRRTLPNSFGTNGFKLTPRVVAAENALRALVDNGLISRVFYVGAHTSMPDDFPDIALTERGAELLQELSASGA